MAVVGFAEEQPRIPIRLLKLEGLLTEAGGRTMLRTAGVDVVVVSMDPSSALIAWKDEDEFHQELVDHSINYLRFGERPVFICPLTGANCYDLYLYRGRWASAKGHGLLRATRHGSRHDRRRAKLESINARLQGLEGLPKARGINRARLVGRALTVPYATHLVADLADAAASEDRKRQKAAARRYRSTRKRGGCSTEAALAGGDAHPYQGVCSNDPGGMLAIIRGYRSGPLDRAALAARPLRKLEDSAALDARVLSRIWTATQSTLATLKWPGDMGGATLFVLAADFRDRSAPSVGLCRLSPDGPGFQILAVEPAGPYKPDNWVFLCPVLGTRHDVLFLRDGLFASAKAQRLIHASQRR
jgi:hypothetical protein